MKSLKKSPSLFPFKKSLSFLCTADLFFSKSK